MRKFKDISAEELNDKVAETFYYYLLSDIIKSHNDIEAFEQAIKIAKDNWSRRDAQVEAIKDIVKRNVDPEETYEEFEDSLFEATEHEIY